MVVRAVFLNPLTVVSISQYTHEQINAGAVIILKISL